VTECEPGRARISFGPRILREFIRRAEGTKEFSLDDAWLPIAKSGAGYRRESDDLGLSPWGSAICCLSSW